MLGFLNFFFHVALVVAEHVTRVDRRLHFRRCRAIRERAEFTAVELIKTIRPSIVCFRFLFYFFLEENVVSSV